MTGVWSYPEFGLISKIRPNIRSKTKYNLNTSI